MPRPTVITVSFSLMLSRSSRIVSRLTRKKSAISQGAGHAAARTGDAGGVPDRAVYLRLHQDEHIQQDRRKQRRVHQQKTDPLLFT